MDFKKLIGITIENVELEESTIYDDDPSVIIQADNGARFRIEGGYGEQTGESAHDYRTTLKLISINPASNKDTLVKKKRGIRVISGNNVKKEYDNQHDMLKSIICSMKKEDLRYLISDLDANAFEVIRMYLFNES